MKEILEIYEDIQIFKKDPTQDAYIKTNNKISSIKEKYMETFDLLNKEEERFTEEIELAQYSIDEEHHDDEIKEVDEYDEEPRELNEDRVSKLKR